MRSKEAIIIGVIIVASLAILSVLYLYERGQKIAVNQSMTTGDGIKVTVQDVSFRPIDSLYTDIIINATVENTTSQSLVPFKDTSGNPPNQPYVCSSYNYNSYNYSGASCVTKDSPTYKAYLEKKEAYDQEQRVILDKREEEKVKLLTPRNSTADIDYNRISSKQDLITLLDSTSRILNPNESISGILVFKVNEGEKGTYVLKYKGKTINIQVNN